MTRKARAKYPQQEATHVAVGAMLDASPELSARMHGWLDLLHSLREKLVKQHSDNRAEQRAVRRRAGGAAKYLTKNDQYRFITALFKSDRRYAGIHSQVLQDVAERVDKGAKSWLRCDQLRKPTRLIEQEHNTLIEPWGKPWRKRSKPPPPGEGGMSHGH